MNKTLPILIAAALMAVRTTAATSTFNTGTEGWTAFGDVVGVLNFDATNGHPGGCAWVDDQASGGVMYYRAPSAFLGNKSAAYGTNLTFDLFQSYSGNADQFNDADVILSGSGLTLAFDTEYNPTNNAWTSYSVLLSESAGWHLGSLSGAVATKSEVQSVLSNLSSLSIRAEYQTGADIDRIDNVTMIPEPATYAGLGGLLALGTALWRRFRR